MAAANQSVYAARPAISAVCLGSDRLAFFPILHDDRRDQRYIGSVPRRVRSGDTGEKVTHVNAIILFYGLRSARNTKRERAQSFASDYNAWA